MREAWDVGKHLLVRAFVSLRELDHSVQDKHFSIVDRIEHQHVLEVRSFMEQHLLHLNNKRAR